VIRDSSASSILNRIDAVFRADSVVPTISAEKDGNLRVVYARSDAAKVVLFGEVFKRP
jgi:hypothetical protein